MVNNRSGFRLTKNNLNRIKRFHEISGPLKKEIASTDFIGSKYEFSKIFLVLSVLSPQQWGPRIERVLIDKLGFKKVKEKGRGDALDKKNNKYFEIKCSIVTVTNNSLNLVQIRNWEEIEGYFVSVLNLLEDGRVYNFYLSKNDMEKEMDLMGSSAHGDKETASKNTYHEKRISVKFDKKDRNFKRWLKNYLTDFGVE